MWTATYNDITVQAASEDLVIAKSLKHINMAEHIRYPFTVTRPRTTNVPAVRAKCFDFWKFIEETDQVNYVMSLELFYGYTPAHELFNFSQYWLHKMELSYILFRQSLDKNSAGNLIQQHSGIKL